MRHIILTIILLSTIKVFGQIPNTLSPSDKLYGLSKFWQEVNYNFVYLDKIDRRMWDNKYKELLSTITNTKNDYEYYRELQKFCALLKDGHTNVYIPDVKGIKIMNTMFGEYRLFVKNFENKAIIVRTNLSKKDEIPFGSEIIEVNGKETSKYIEENVAPYISTSTDHILMDESIENLLRGLEGESYQIKVKRPDKSIISLNLTHAETIDKEVFPALDDDQQLLDFKWLNSKTAYVALHSFDDPLIDSLFIEKLPELYKAKSLIIDLRNNGGGSSRTALNILQYLTSDSILFGAKSVTRENIATYKAYGSFFTATDTLTDKPEWGMTKSEIKKYYQIANNQYYFDFPYSGDTIQLSAKRIVIPTVILIGHKTASAAEDFLIFSDNQKHMTKIGENTYGSTGQPYMFDLPGGGLARVCTKKDTYPDGREFVGYGIKPDIVVKTTLNDFLIKKDPTLDKAIELLKTK